MWLKMMGIFLSAIAENKWTNESEQANGLRVEQQLETSHEQQRQWQDKKKRTYNRPIGVRPKTIPVSCLQFLFHILIL